MKKNIHMALMPEQEQPTLRLTSDLVPEIKNWMPGEKYHIYVEIEQVSMEVGSEWDPNVPKDLVRATFKVKAVAVEEEEKDEDYETERARLHDERRA